MKPDIEELRTMVQDYIERLLDDGYYIDLSGLVRQDHKRDHWPDPDHRRVITSDMLSYGDYDNSCHVERANVKVMKEFYGEQPWFDTCTGIYGYEQAYIDATKAVETMRTGTYEELDLLHDALRGVMNLADYPALDDEACSIQEMEMVEEAVDMDISEIENRIRGEVEDYEDRDEYVDIDTDALKTIVLRAVNNNMGNPHHIQSGGVVYIDWDQVWEDLDPDDVFSVWTVNKFKPENQPQI